MSYVLKMAVETSEIDLYADDLGEEFNQENDYNESGLDLYDDVITPSANIKREDEDYGLPQDNGTVHHVNSNDAGGDGVGIGSSGGQSSKKIGLYVGNLSWWTTDQDVMDAILDLGVNDIFEVKFFENRANGQSKGFCVVTLGSDNSVRTVIEKLPKNEIHAQNPVVTPCNRQNLNHFEMQSRKTAPGGPGGGPQHVGGQQNFPNQRSGFGGPPPSGGMRPPLIQRPVRPNGPLLPGQPRMPMGPHQGMPPFGPGQPQWGPGMGPNQGPPRPPAPIHPGAPPGMGNMPLMRMPPQQNRGPVPQQPLLRGPSTQSDPRTQMAHPGGPMPDWANDHNPHAHGPPGPQNMVLSQPGQSQPNPSLPPRVPPNEFSGQVPGMPPVGGPHSGPAPHVNPAFFHAQQHTGLAPQQQTDQYGNRLPPGAVQYGHGDYRGPVPGMDVSIPLQINEQEFEEIMSKNRTVSSSAIARAVTDASSGDFAAAIETLVTAISLIKQSKVAPDERCKILISSLQDTLHGIESKSYSNTSSRKDRPRSRERSRERTSRREKSRRDRSRSRERDYRDRSRDRYHDSERYHETERYRDKDRERERDHRSSRH